MPTPHVNVALTIYFDKDYFFSQVNFVITCRQALKYADRNQWQLHFKIAPGSQGFDMNQKQIQMNQWQFCQSRFYCGLLNL